MLSTAQIAAWMSALTYHRNRKDEDKVVGRDRRTCRAAISTGRPKRIGEIWLPTQVPSTCSRHFPAAVNTPVENDSSTMSGTSRTQQRFRLDCVLPRRLPGCPVLSSLYAVDTLELWCVPIAKDPRNCVEKFDEVVIPFDIVFFTGSCPVSVEGFPQLRHALHTWTVGVQRFCHHGQNNGCHLQQFAA